VAAYLDLGISITAINNATRPLRQVGDDVKRVGDNAQATANRLKAIQVVIAGILINKTLELGRAFAKMAADNQALDIRMAAFAGNAQKAAGVQDALNKKFAASGLIVDDLAQNFIDVRNAVSSNEQGVKLVESMANAVLALGGNQRNVDNLANSFQKLGGRGSVTMRDLNSIIQNTSITLPDLAKAAGKTALEFEGALRNGFLNSATFIDAFTKASEAKIGNWSKGLASTIGGSMGFIANSLDEAVGDLGKRTDINARMATLFTNIGNAIKGFIGSIDQSKVDAFFNFLRDMEPVVTRLIVAIAKIGAAVLALGQIIGRMLGMLPQEAYDYGIIGYMLFGKKGAIIGALIAGAEKKLRDFGKTVDQFAIDNNFFADYFRADKAKLDKSTLDALLESLGGANGGKRTGKSIFGDEKDWAAMSKSISDMIAKAGSFGSNNPNGISYMLSEAIEKAKALKQEMQDLADATAGRIQLMNFRTVGDDLGEKIQTIKNETNGWVDALEKGILKLMQSKVHVDGEAALIAQMRKGIEDANLARDAAIVKAQKLYDLTKRQTILDDESARLSARMQSENLADQMNGGVAFNMLAGTGAGQLSSQTQAQLLQFQSQFLDYTKQINDLKMRQLDTIDPGIQASIQQTIDAYSRLKDEVQTAMEQLDASAESNKAMWKELGSSIFSSLHNGINGLIQGTQSLGDTMRGVFSDMISMAIKYLLQLVLIQQQQSLLSAFGGGGGGVGGILSMFMGAFANGGAFSGGITPFANGGVVQGPTLFGLAGEKGDEAILPLTRVGGKMGVHASGGGGNSYNINISAIDTQTGLDFVAKHIADIDGNLEHQRRLNRRTRKE
jgi:tape measure domain-containing protein